MSSQTEIQALRAQGFTDTQIGRAVGRDSSLISQIGKGAKPGRNLETALRSLVEAGARPGDKATVQPTARTGKGGAAARVRQSGKTALPGGNVLVEAKARGKNLLAQLRAAAKQGKGVSFSAGVRRIKRYKDSQNVRGQEVSVFGKGGYDAGKFLASVEGQPGFDANNPQAAFDAALVQYMTASGSVEEAHGVTGVVMQTFSRR